jgi:hypothetical protein
MLWFHRPRLRTQPYAATAGDPAVAAARLAACYPAWDKLMYALKKVFAMTP